MKTQFLLTLAFMAVSLIPAPDGDRIYCVVVDVFPEHHEQEVRIFCETADPLVERRWDQINYETAEFREIFGFEPKDGQVLIREASHQGKWIGLRKSKAALPRAIQRLVDYAK